MNEQSIDLTIIVTVYNKESDLPRCLKSLDEQSDPRFYALVVDDGSTDRSGEILRDWAKQHGNEVEVLTRGHSGVAASRNLGLSAVRTDYVIFLDGDDSLVSTAVERFNQEIRAGACDLTVYGFSHQLTNGKTHIKKCPDVRFETKERISSSLAEIWNTGLMYSSCNKLFHTALIREHELSFPASDFGEDIIFCQDYLRYCGSLRMIPDTLYRYVYHNKGTLSTRYREDMFERRLAEHLQMISFFDDMGCTTEEAAEYMARRHIERIVGCVENEQSPDSPYSTGERYRRIRRIILDPYTQSCAATAQRSGWKMRLLILPVRKRMIPAVFFLGTLMSFCRNRFPNVFAELKYR